MIIPKPKKNEKESDFIQRCMDNAVMKSGYPDVKLRAGISFGLWRDKDNKDLLSEFKRPVDEFKFECIECSLPTNDDDGVCFKCGGDLIQFKNPDIQMKLETVDIDKDVHIFTVGNWKGHEYTEREVDGMIANYKNNVAEPYITLDHNPGLTKLTQDFFKAMGLGFAKDLKRVGKNVYANFRKVPKMLAELIDAGAMKQRSVEMTRNFRHANGRKYNLVLTGVTFHGGNGLPAISTLEDIPKLFKGVEADYKIKSTVQNKGEFISISANEFNSAKQENLKSKKGKNIMEISDKEYQDLISESANLKAENKRLAEKEEQFKTDKEDSTKKYDEAVKLKKEADEKLETFEKATEEQLKAEATAFADKLIKDKKRLPKFKEMDVDRYVELKKAGDENALELFKEDLSGRASIGKDGEILEDIDDSSSEDFQNIDYKTEEDVKRNDLKDHNKVDKAIKNYMKANSLVGSDGYAKAYTVVVENGGDSGEVQ